MGNRIRDIEVRDRLHDPAEPELWIGVVPETESATLEVRGRLMGPRCAYASTVEVAYPLRPFPRPPEGLSHPRRVIIPEASLWDPESPFLYQGPVELWDEGQRRDQVEIRHGLRMLNLGRCPWRINGKPVTIRAVAARSRDDLPALHESGCNTLVVPVNPENVAYWDDGDRLGFLVLGRLDPTPEQLALARGLSRHPCCLGWILDHNFDSVDSEDMPGPAVGVRLRDVSKLEALSSFACPGKARFVVCDESLLPALEGVELPRIVECTGEQRCLQSPGVVGTLQC